MWRQPRQQKQAPHYLTEGHNYGGNFHKNLCKTAWNEGFSYISPFVIKP
ncbi:hypothetical protein CLOSTMETH_02180 [[Clostridium] methylpentosum DSM 5476]|uniref:Uncharacterized protein n=1 Tax=[Clostridium] methylpentosum DSM 5476 TaxID=537013 RepID=C0EEA0_9FIRM|nr:hypothetical protein CLOSTMETH_02180 [[Clostridium] methylpentosum DSM 5476]